MPSLILLRHGESLFNRQGRFTGWADPPLSAAGRQQALAAGRQLRDQADPPGAVFCSRLIRARQTLELALWAAGVDPGAAWFSWRLNERHCGRWEGLVKREVDHPGLAAWRDQLQARPPLLAGDDPRHPRHDPLHRDLPPALLPGGESHADLSARVRPLWRERIAPSLRRRRCVWVVAHSGSLWALANLVHEASGHLLAPRSFPLARPCRLDLAPDLTPLAWDL